MIIHFLKFFHLLFALGLLSGVIYCCAVNKINKILLVLCFFAALTGTFLVYPKHFTFHTPWIQAAYLLTLIVGIGIFFLMTTKNKWRFFYFLLIMLLIFITHDAVMKTTLF